MLADHGSLALLGLQQINPDQEDSVQDVAQVVGDLLSLKPSLRSEIGPFLERATVLGITRLSQLTQLKQQDLAPRLGLLALECVLRVQGTSALAMHPVQVPKNLETVFFPELDRAMQSDLEREQGVYGRVIDVLSLWSKALQRQALVLRGLAFELQFELAGQRNRIHAFEIKFPKATRDLDSIQKILFEKWTFESERIQKVIIKTMGFDPEPKSQLSFFSGGGLGEPEKVLDLESEEVGVFLGQMVARSTPDHPIDFGFFQPVMSCLPEKSLKWKSLLHGSAEKDLPSLQAEKSTLEYTPYRPQFLLKNPKKIKKISREDQFFNWVAEHGGNVRGLESIEGRWYARVLLDGKNLWVFWNSETRVLYQHGYFE